MALSCGDAAPAVRKLGFLLVRDEEIPLTPTRYRLTHEFRFPLCSAYPVSLKPTRRFDGPTGGNTGPSPKYVRRALATTVGRISSN